MEQKIGKQNKIKEKKSFQPERNNEENKSPLRSLLKLDDSNIQTTIFSNQKYDTISSLDPYFSKHLEKLNFSQMTKIQQKSFSAISDLKNTLLKAQTGSGKTLAYLVPLLNRLIKKPERIKRNDGCKILIICPTRELCLQIEKVLESLTKGCIWIVGGAFIGGNDIKKEKARIRKGINVVVGTPGKLDYHLKSTNNFSMKDVETIVFEEADQILDMGFAKEVSNILDIVRQQRKGEIQNVLVAASISGRLETFLRDVLLNSFMEKEKEEDLKKQKLEEILQKFELVGFEEDAKKFIVPETLNHFYTIIEERKKLSFTITLLKLLENEKVIIFVSTTDQANYLHNLFQNLKTPSYSFNAAPEEKKLFSHKILKIHAYMEQKERAEVFYEFNNLEKGFLFCTNVASRGLDFGSISVILLFDVSPSYKDYINRVGRTARIEKTGSAISLLYEKEANYAKKLEENCGANEIKSSTIEAIYEDNLLKNQKIKNFAQFFDMAVKNLVNSNQDVKYLARRAFNSFCRAYNMLKDEECFNLKNLNIHQISKSYGLVSSMSENTKDSKYQNIKDSKNISHSEQSYLDLKKQKTQLGYKLVQKKSFGNDEFL